jgi:hypothetical protein
MPGHGGRLHEDSGVHERRDRAEDGLGVFEPLLGVVMEEELEVGERMSVGIVLDGTSLSARTFRVREIRKLPEWRRQV